MLGNQNLYCSVCLGQVVLGILNYQLVRGYLQPPKSDKPKFKFFASPQAELLGDIFLFLNMILAQAFLGYVIIQLRHDQRLVFEFGLADEFIQRRHGSRLEEFVFSFLIFYLPPRFIYLLEDKHRKVTWATMLLANLPVVYLIFFARG